MDKSDNTKFQNENQIDNSSKSTSQSNNVCAKSSKSNKNKNCNFKCVKKSNKCSSKKKTTNYNTTNNNKLNLELYKYSYADFVLLSSTLAYGISEDLIDADIDILITFLGMLTADLALLRTKRGIIDGLAKAKQAAGSSEEESAIIGATEATQGAESVASDLSRKLNNSKLKRVKKKKIKKKNKNNKKVNDNNSKSPKKN